MTILDKIIERKRIEIAERKKTHPVNILTQMPYFKEPCFSLKRSLKRANSTGIIAEHKRKSPSLGWIREHSNVREVVEGYAAAGAACLSVLTDTDFFGGSFADLTEARKAVNILIFIKNCVEKYPTKRNNENANTKFSAGQNTKIARRYALNRPFSPKEKARPSDHRRKEIGGGIYRGVYAALSGHFWMSFTLSIKTVA